MLQHLPVLPIFFTFGHKKIRRKVIFIITVTSNKIYFKNYLKLSKNDFNSPPLRRGSFMVLAYAIIKKRLFDVKKIGYSNFLTHILIASLSAYAVHFSLSLLFIFRILLMSAGMVVLYAFVPFLCKFTDDIDSNIFIYLSLLFMPIKYYINISNYILFSRHKNKPKSIYTKTI